MEMSPGLEGLTGHHSLGLPTALSLISRGGARFDSIAPDFYPLDESLMLIGGAQDGISNNLNLLGLSIPPEGRAVLYMATAMAIHYLAYSFARPSTIALFTSKQVGFKSPAAFPFAMAFISPSSLCLLLLYGRIIDQYGPRAALRRTTMLCSCVLVSAAAAIMVLSDKMNGGPVISLFGFSFPLIKALVGALFIFRESYVQLLTSQHWSFMASVLNPSQSATWFAPISGLTSILSAVAGLLTSTVIKSVGLPGVLAFAGISLCISLVFSERAYSVAETVRLIYNRAHYTNLGMINENFVFLLSSMDLILKPSTIGKRRRKKLSIRWRNRVKQACSEKLQTCLLAFQHSADCFGRFCLAKPCRLCLMCALSPNLVKRFPRTANEQDGPER